MCDVSSISIRIIMHSESFSYRSSRNLWKITSMEKGPNNRVFGWLAYWRVASIAAKILLSRHLLPQPPLDSPSISPNRDSAFESILLSKLFPLRAPALEIFRWVLRCRRWSRSNVAYRAILAYISAVSPQRALAPPPPRGSLWLTARVYRGKPERGWIGRGRRRVAGRPDFCWGRL